MHVYIYKTRLTCSEVGIISREMKTAHDNILFEELLKFITRGRFSGDYGTPPWATGIVLVSQHGV